MDINENTLEQVIISDLQQKGYEYLYGPDIERDYHEVILEDCFFSAISGINERITSEMMTEVLRTIKDLGLLQLEARNMVFHKYLIEGVPVSYKKDGENRTYTVKLIDFKHPEKNDFKVVNQFTVIEYKQKRPDLLVFINGIPMVLFELKSIASVDATIEVAYQQIKNYQLDIPKLFQYNAFNVVSDGLDAKMGTITSDFTRYMAWKSVNGEKPEEGNLNYFTVLLNGVFEKERLLDLIQNFILFQDHKGRTVKILAAYHQYFMVKKAVESTKNALLRNSHKAGVVWHTQGSGKSLSMVFYAGMIVKDQEFSNPTIVVLTDRNDLDNQLFSTFSSCSKTMLRQTPKHAESRTNLKELLKVKAGGIIFTTIQKFEEGTEVLSDRSNIIFMADEAHRSQYGLDAKLDKVGRWKYGMAKHMRDALPNATFIGFTGTPISTEDKSTVEVFGDYIDIYDMTQAVEDGATVPIYYENRTTKLKLNDSILKEIDAEFQKISGEYSEVAIEQSKLEYTTLEALVGSKERLNMLADDIIAHYEDRQYVLTGKAMIVCMSRRIAINLYKILLEKRPSWDDKVKVVLTASNKDPEDWHDLIGNKAYKDQLAIEFKDDLSPLKIVIVVDMWLTGFDVPSLATMYVDKPMKGHNLMQAIARVNRVYKDKEAGLVVDYIGMAAELKSALSQYTQRDKNKVPDLSQAFQITMGQLEVMRDIFYGFNYQDFFGQDNAKRLSVIASGVNFALGFEEDEKKDFIKEATKLSQAETLCRSMLDDRTKKEIELFKCIKAGVCKYTIHYNRITSNEFHSRIMKMLEQAVEQDGIVNIFQEAGKKNPEISILSDEYMEKVRKMKHKNIAAEMLRNLLEDNIKVIARTGLVKSQLFSEKMKGVMKRYNNRLITSAEVIEELLNLSKEITEAVKSGEEKGLTSEELAFYDALAADPNVLIEMKDAALIGLAKELTELIRRSRTVDWDKKQSARAYMRTQVKHLLRRYKYPPEQARGAIETVIKQAELMSANMAV